MFGQSTLFKLNAYACYFCYLSHSQKQYKEKYIFLGLSLEIIYEFIRTHKILL